MQRIRREGRAHARGVGRSRRITLPKTRLILIAALAELTDANSFLNTRNPQNPRITAQTRNQRVERFPHRITPVQPESSVLRGPSGVQSVCKSVVSTPQPIDFGVTKHFRSSWALWGYGARSAPWRSPRLGGCAIGA
jgi:hypothetical protein